MEMFPESFSAIKESAVKQAIQTLRDVSIKATVGTTTAVRVTLIGHYLIGFVKSGFNPEHILGLVYGWDYTGDRITCLKAVQKDHNCFYPVIGGKPFYEVI